MQHDHEADRELVQQTFSREWGEPVCGVRIAEFAPSFKVPGRQLNGSPSSEHRVRRFFANVWLTLYFLLALAVSAFFNADAPFGPSTEGYRGRVRGSEGSSAVQFAELLRGGSFWLVMSTSGLAAVRTGSSPPVIVMWSAMGAARPQWEGDGRTLLWPDGSTVYFILADAERQRLVGV